MNAYKEHTSCRVCGDSRLVKCVDLGIQPFANDHRKSRVTLPVAPLELLFCESCKLGQLSVVVRPEILYSKYSYTTSRTETMRSHLAAVWRDLCSVCGFAPSRVLEVGSNDGFCLKLFSDLGASSVLGLDPADNLADISRKSGIDTITGFLSSDFVDTSGISKHYFDAVVLRHVFCHIDDWHDAMEAVSKCLGDKSIAYIEVPHIARMAAHGEWDTIYHEHLSYMSVTAISNLALMHGLKVVSVKKYQIHGGSIGVFLSKSSCRHADESVSREIGCESSVTAQALREMPVDSDCNRLRLAIDSASDSGARVVGFGAPAKATVICNRAGIRRDRIAAMFDSTPWKQGCFVPGTDILILPPCDLSAVADVAVMFPWNFSSEILDKNKQFTSAGGKFLMPVCGVRLVP